MYRRPAELPRARLPLLDQVTIKTPCRESWDGMTGDDRVRFCARCSKDVYDLSAMTEDEAETFLATHLDDENTCVRLYRRPDGRILTSECVQGARTRHARKVAAGVAFGLCASFAGTLALANVHLPSGRNLPRTRARIEVARLSVASFENAARIDDDTSSLQGDAVAEVRGDSMGGMTVSRAARPPALIDEGRVTTEAGYSTDVVRRIVRQRYGVIRLCYEAALAKRPQVAGAVFVRFAIERDGSVRVVIPSSDLEDPSADACIARQFRSLAFPATGRGGNLAVSYELWLKPGP
jgi:hypothetical protein